MTTAVVFGASGFIGRHARAALEGDERIDQVVCPGRDVCDLVQMDVSGLAGFLDGAAADVVVNCTGRLDGSTHELVQSNVMVTAKLLDALTSMRRRVRFLRIGSAGEYGRVPQGRSVAEDDPASPISDYGASHLAATRLVELAAAAGRVDGLTLRVFNPIGPGMAGDTVLRRAAARIHEAMSNQDGIVMLGPLGAYRDFVDGRDVGAAVLAAALASGAPPTVNVASGRAVLVREAVRVLSDRAGFTGEILESEGGSGNRRSAGVDWISGDIRAARESLRWEPRYPLDESVDAIWVDETRVPGMVGRS